MYLEPNPRTAPGRYASSDLWLLLELNLYYKSCFIVSKPPLERWIRDGIHPNVSGEQKLAAL